MTININYLRPCPAAATRLKTQPDITAWNVCEQGDWMMWLLTKLDTPKEISVTLAIKFARSVLQHGPEGEERPRLAIEAAERWLAEPTPENAAAAAAAALAAQANIIREVVSAEWVEENLK